MLKFIPRPGPWMETMKQLMGFPMVATAAWFAASFVKLQGGENAELRVDAMKSLLFGTVAISAAAWVFGKWAAIHREPRTRWIATVSAVALIAAGSIYAIQKPVTTFEPWSPEKIAMLRAQGKPVFVDFTAEWCAICQVNKKIIERDDVVAKFKSKGVTLMIADWTDQNDRIGAGLKEFNREAVPLYLLYGRDGSKPPQILPQALTPGMLTEALDKL
jgi:thiol:disulfide interchange protein DsbD